MDPELIGVLDQTIVLLAQNREDELKSLLASLHPADLAEVLHELEDAQRAAILRHISDEIAAEVLAEMGSEDQASILKTVGLKRAAAILNQMSNDDVADLVAMLSPEEAGELLRLMDAEDASDVRELMGFREDTAGGIMTTEYIALAANLTAQGAIEELRKLAPDVETAYYVYVIDKHDKLVGVLSLRELIIAPPDEKIHRIMRKQVVAVHVNDDQEEVARVVQKYNLLAVPVVDDNDVLRGIVTVDDIIDVLEEEATEDIYRAAGVGRDRLEPDYEDGIWRAVKARLPWLLGLLFLSLVSGLVIERFTSLLAAVHALSIFITTMAGGSGNAATQALTVTVRGMATGELEQRQLLRVVWREIRVGLVIGLICGAALGTTAWLWQGSPWIGLIAFLAIFINLVLAKAAGTLVPVIIQRLGFDPAVASAPFIATVTDTTSMLIYFGIASLIIHLVGYSL